jgi:hypothetical protein
MRTMLFVVISIEFVSPVRVVCPISREAVAGSIPVLSIDIEPAVGATVSVDRI